MSIWKAAAKKLIKVMGKDAPRNGELALGLRRLSSHVDLGINDEEAFTIAIAEAFPWHEEEFAAACVAVVRNRERQLLAEEFALPMGRRGTDQRRQVLH